MEPLGGKDVTERPPDNLVRPPDNLVLEGAILANEALLSWIRGWATGLPQEALISLADILNNAIVMAANAARVQQGHIPDALERYEAAKRALEEAIK